MSSDREPSETRFSRSVKGAKAKPANNRLDDEWAKLSQREKFIRTAREVGADETGEALDEALKAIGRARKR